VFREYCHEIRVESDSARFPMSIENVPSKIQDGADYRTVGVAALAQADHAAADRDLITRPPPRRRLLTDGRRPPSINRGSLLAAQVERHVDSAG